MKLDSNNHSVFKMYYHLVLVTKYRRKVLDNNICEYLEKRFNTIGESYNLHLEEMNHDLDHLHILFRAEPKSNISKFINAYKSSTSRKIKELFPYVTEKLWESKFWSQSFCLITTGGAPIEVIKQYIESQGENHD
ncbi:IS200/IS605 family transposase [Candidatus Izemoplasma sp. B36]|uniref:IS200/IS605 family transposase n=1 Tax=Candidatus Izemoplasma sp. B36 TaxID=3242468 RepID=UPI0035580DF7